MEKTEYKDYTIYKDRKNKHYCIYSSGLEGYLSAKIVSEELEKKGWTYKSKNPDEVCFDCGNKYGSMPKGHSPGCWRGTCGICGKEKMVTAPRDFRGLPKWKG